MTFEVHSLILILHFSGHKLLYHITTVLCAGFKRITGYSNCLTELTNDG